MMPVACVEPPSSPRTLCANDAPTAGAARAATGTVLVVSSAFPPSGGPGVQRTAKFVRYLADLGWRPVVLAAEPLAELPQDETLANEMPAGLPVARRPAGNLIAAARRWTRTTTADGGMGRRVAAAIQWRIGRLALSLSKAFLSDPYLPWAIRSIPVGMELIRRHRVNVVFSTFSPIANHLLGGWLARSAGLPWIADFRDLWTDDYCYTAPRWRRPAERWLEQRILRRATRIVAVTDSQRDLLASHVPDRADRFTTITNGFDPEDFEAATACKSNACAVSGLSGNSRSFRLVFTGWFLTDRVSNGLFDGIARFAREMAAHGRSFEFIIVGTVGNRMRRRLRDAQIPLHTTGYQTHLEAIVWMKAADLLLLPTPSGPNAETLIPAKLFEYLAAQRPILAIGSPNSEPLRLASRLDAGWTIPDNPEAVRNALVDAHHRWEKGRLRSECETKRLEPFTRKAQATQLAELLAEVIRMKHSP